MTTSHTPTGRIVHETSRHFVWKRRDGRYEIYRKKDHKPLDGLYSDFLEAATRCDTLSGVFYV